MYTHNVTSGSTILVYYFSCTISSSTLIAIIILSPTVDYELTASLYHTVSQFSTAEFKFKKTFVISVVWIKH